METVEKPVALALLPIPILKSSFVLASAPIAIENFALPSATLSRPIAILVFAVALAFVPIAIASESPERAFTPSAIER